jgi:hypothetical protein
MTRKGSQMNSKVEITLPFLKHCEIKARVVFYTPQVKFSFLYFAVADPGGRAC